MTASGSGMTFDLACRSWRRRTGGNLPICRSSSIHGRMTAFLQHRRRFAAYRIRLVGAESCSSIVGGPVFPCPRAGRFRQVRRHPRHRPGPLRHRLHPQLGRRQQQRPREAAGRSRTAQGEGLPWDSGAPGFLSHCRNPGRSAGGLRLSSITSHVVRWASPRSGASRPLKPCGPSWDGRWPRSRSGLGTSSATEANSLIAPASVPGAAAKASRRRRWKTRFHRQSWNVSS